MRGSARWTLIGLLALTAGGAFVAQLRRPEPARGTPLGTYADDGSHPDVSPADVTAPARNVVLVVIDTWRADTLGVPAEGGDGGSMPLLTERAKRGVQFTNAAASSSWTLPSLTSLLTGRLPSDHHIEGEEGQASGLASLPTWAEILKRESGYETVAWVGGPWGHGDGTMFEGFDVLLNGAGLQAAPRLLTTWSRRRDPSRPFFLLIHTFEAHDPYGAENHPYPHRSLIDPERPDPLATLTPDATDAEIVRAFTLDGATREAIFREPGRMRLMERFTRAISDRFAEQPDPELASHLETAYRRGVSWVDGLLDRTLSSLEGAGMLKDTLLLVTGDHGEAFGEHGMLLHARRLDEELVRVPLVCWGPAPFDRPQRLASSVGLTDLLPTTLDLLGLPPLGSADGRSLLPMVRGERAGHPTTAQVVRKPLHTGGLSDAVLESVRDDAWKVIVTFDRHTGTVREEAFNLLADPEQRHDLADAHGRATGLAFDEPFCEQLERARARVWRRVAESLIEIEPASGAEPGQLASGTRPAAACDDLQR